MTQSIAPGTVWFVGAGPGDPELITLKGKKRIEEAALVLYAGSLVPPAIVACANAQAQVVDSSPLTLEQCHALMRQTALSGQQVARVHTGDPSLYGTTREQMRLLAADGIPCAVVPGITSACAAAAAAGISFTVPEVCQSLIFTRMAGRTPVPHKERLRLLAAHGCSLAVYLSAADAMGVQHELLESLPPHTPVICAYRVGWPDQKLIWCSLDQLAATVRTEGLNRQTVFLILPGQDAADTASRLYAADFEHGWRKV